MQTKRIKIIPALHGKLTRSGKLSEPDIYYIMEKWLERHPTFKGREQEFRIVTGRWTLREVAWMEWTFGVTSDGE